MRKRRSPRLRAIVLLLLVAGVGFCAGLLTERLVLSRSGLAADPGPEPWPSGPGAVIGGGSPESPLRGDRVFRLGLPAQLAEELDLSAEQRAEVERILAEDQAALRQVMEEFRPSLTAIIERSRRKIYQVLTAEQIERWQESPALRLRRGN